MKKDEKKMKKMGTGYFFERMGTGYFFAKKESGFYYWTIQAEKVACPLKCPLKKVRK